MGNSLHPPPEVIASWPHPNYADPITRGPALVYVCVILSSLSLCLVTARIYARVLITRALGLDDFFCILSLVFGVALAALIIIANKQYGTGRHMWDLPISWAAPNRLLTWASEWCYILASSSIKISILLFYKRLSHPFPLAFRVATWVGIIYNVGYAVGFGLALGLLCQPIEAYWNQFSPQWLKAGNTFSCAREEISLPLSGALSVVGDFYSTILPLILVWHLKMERKKKLRLYSLFALGFLVVAAGIVRTVLLNTVINKTWDVLWELYTMWIWTIVELNVAIIAASAPALKSFFQHCLFQPTATLYKRAMTPGGTFSGARDEKRMEDATPVYGGITGQAEPKLEEIGIAIGELETGLAMDSYVHKP